MSDRLTVEKRSQLMSRIRAKDTCPELRVRRWLHGRGYRYRLHVKRLPGRPDIVMPRYGAVIMVHGCFWHRHHGCRLAYEPRSNVEFWQRKFAQNIDRDRRSRAALMELGWRMATVWECALREQSGLEARLMELESWLRNGQAPRTVEITL